MRAPKSWIAEYAALPDGLTGRALGEALVRHGLEVETVESIGEGVSGPVVVARVLDFVEEPQKNGKVVRWCHVDAGAQWAPAEAPQALRGEAVAPLPGGYFPRGIVCGAHNFASGDAVVVALPGSVLPGGFELSSRKTYGHVSDGMICAVDELGVGSDHTGIFVFPPDADVRVGSDALDAMGVRDDVLDMPVTPDMGYCLSIRGLAREAAQALDVAFTDPVDRATPAPVAAGRGVRIETDACSLFVAVTVEGVDPTAATPQWMAARLEASGMRSISLPVDVSNYVMLETGQPNHCYDADVLAGDIVVRQAEPGERLVTLDGVDRALDPADMVIADAQGPIGLAGVMGGERTEITDATRTVVVEAAHFDPVTIARMSRRAKLSSEASKRFERSVDQGAAYAAAHRVADLLVEWAGGRVAAAETIAGAVMPMPTCELDPTLPQRILGMPVDAERAIAIWERSGVMVERTGDRVRLTPPSWRSDLVDPYDYVEEVGTKIGLDQLPDTLPPKGPGAGYTTAQQLRRALGRALAAAGFVEVLSFPFLATTDADALGLPAADARRDAVRLANPLADTSPFLRTTLLPGLFGSAQRNTSRGLDDLALFEIGSVFFAGAAAASPMPAVTRRPSDDDIAALDATLPRQPRHLSVLVSGAWERPGWQGSGRSAGWQQALGAADVVAGVLGLDLEREAAAQAPWHPGRCARLSIGGVTVGFGGELHPAVVRAYGLPARSAALELDLDALLDAFAGAGVIAPVSPHPVAKEDVALVVDADVPAEALRQALLAGGGELVESATLFDVYTGAPVPDGQKSVAFALRLRASDRTLKDVEIAAAREAAVARAVSEFGARLRDF